MITRFLCAGACIVLTLGSAAAKPGVALTTVNLRAEANTTSEVLAKIPGSGRLDVGACNNGWCAATYQGKNGFVIATAVDASPRGPGRAAMSRTIPPAPGYDPDDEGYVPVPGYSYPAPPVVYGPGPYWGPRPYFGWGWGPRWGYGWRRW